MNLLSHRIIRYSFAILFVWFGTQQLFFPDMWIGFLPVWTGYLPIPGAMLVQLNGWFEIMAAVCLCLGLYTRVVAALLALHLFGIAVSAGGAIGIRDAVLAMMGIALATSADEDPWTLDVMKENVTANT